MTALSFSVSPAVRTSLAPAAAAAPPARPVQAASDVERRSPVSPTTSVSVANETIAAIQQLGASGVTEQDTTALAAAAEARADEPKSFPELQAEARRWERYYSHQPRRLADLLAVYYGGQQTSLDPRGPAAKPLAEYISRGPKITEETDGAPQS